MLRRFDKICWDFRTISSWILESLQWRRILVRSSPALIFETNPELWCWERWPDHVTGIPLIVSVDERFLHNFSWKLIYEILKTVLLIRNRFSSNHLGVSTKSNGVFSYVGDYYQYVRIRESHKLRECRDWWRKSHPNAISPIISRRYEMNFIIRRSSSRYWKGATMRFAVKSFY